MIIIIDLLLDFDQCNILSLHLLICNNNFKYQAFPDLMSKKKKREEERKKRMSVCSRRFN
jgi:hypothetical protein